MGKRIVCYLICFLSFLIIFEFSFGYGIIGEKEEVKKTQYMNIEPAKFFEIISFEIYHEHIYLAINDTKKIDFTLEVYSNYEEELSIKSNNELVAQVDKNAVVKAVGVGTTSIEFKIKDVIKVVNVTVSDLINVVSRSFDKNKKLLQCNIYSEEENDLLDDILEARVNEALYKTRAGVVAVARFITLEFPYKIGYFSENGRVTTYGNTNYVDGEGRYYHKGLYLHKSRLKNIAKSMYGPNIWGCQIFSFVSDGYRRNGFDCSGFITWILLNGGFDSGDIGAGISSVNDLTDLGIKKSITNSLNNKVVKAGDLLSGPNINGGHIAMVIGIKDGNYYVAECLWGNGEYGAIVRTYTKDNITNYFKWHVDMNEYYIEDGNYTEHWI